MRNQFVGDINDYYKYTLLNYLAESSPVNVCWMLNPDIDGQNSKFTKYPDYDDLAVFLKGLVKIDERHIKNIEYTHFVNIKNYYEQIADIPENIDGVLFFDPDNGIEVKSSKKGDKRYLFYDDISRFIKKVDILVYQHFPRVPRDKYMKIKTQEILNKVICSDVIHYPRSMVDFILIKK